jgi:CheY-like chemotaxis protein
VTAARPSIGLAPPDLRGVVAGKGLSGALALRLPGREATRGREPHRAGGETMIMGRLESRVVLVIEDDRDVREIVRDLLEDAGYEVAAVRHGGEAQEYLLKNPAPAMVLLDLMMPNMNGWQFLTWLEQHEDLADLPVVLLSAAPDHGVALAKRTRTVHGCLPKPFDPEALVEVVGQACAA